MRCPRSIKMRVSICESLQSLPAIVILAVPYCHKPQFAASLYL